MQGLTASASVPAGRPTLPVLTWSAGARSALSEFCAHASDLPELTTVIYAPHEFSAAERTAFAEGRSPTGILPHEASPSWHLDLAACPPPAQRAVRALARSLCAQSMPEAGAALLTGMLDPIAPELTGHVIGALRAAIVELHGGDGLAAIAKPTDSAGEDPDLGEVGDGSMYPHCDLWRPERILGIFDRVVDGAGLPTLLPLVDLWPLAERAGMPAQVQVELQHLVDTASDRTSTYEAFAGGLYDDPRWGDELAALASSAAAVVPGGRGDGYLVDDRRWMHGRTALPWEHYPREMRHRRLYLLAYTAAVSDEPAALVPVFDSVTAP